MQKNRNRDNSTKVEVRTQRIEGKSNGVSAKILRFAQNDRSGLC